MARAKQYTLERTRERLAKMHASPTPSPMELPQSCRPLPEVARGRGMTHHADRYYVQEALRNMSLQDQPPHLGMPAHEDCPTTPEVGQYNSPDLDNQEEEDLTSQADFDSEEEYTDAMGHSGRSLPAERNRRRNRAMCRERVHAKHNFC